MPSKAENYVLNFEKTLNRGAYVISIPALHSLYLWPKIRRQDKCHFDRRVVASGQGNSIMTITIRYLPHLFVAVSFLGRLFFGSHYSGMRCQFS